MTNDRGKQQGFGGCLSLVEAHLEDARAALAGIRQDMHSPEGAQSRMDAIARAKEAVDSIDLAEEAMRSLAI